MGPTTLHKHQQIVQITSYDVCISYHEMSPSGHCQHYYPGTHRFNQVTTTRPMINEIWLNPIFKCVAVP